MSRLFDGNDDYVSTGVPTVLNTFWVGGATLAFWAYPTGLGGGGFGMAVSRRNSNGWQTYVCNDAAGGVCSGIANTWMFIQITSSQLGAWAMGADTLEFNKWQHIVIYYNSDNLGTDPLMWKNGVPQTVTETLTPSGNAAYDDAADFVIGNRDSANAFNRAFQGKLANVHAYKRQLSLGEIMQIMKFPGSVSKNLVGFWPLHGSSSPEPDVSGNKSAGTVVGALKGADDPPINGIFQVPKPELMGAF